MGFVDVCLSLLSFCLGSEGSRGAWLLDSKQMDGWGQHVIWLSGGGMGLLSHIGLSVCLGRHAWGFAAAQGERAGWLPNSGWDVR